MSFLTKELTMAMETNKLPQVRMLLPQEDTNNSMKLMENQARNVKVQCDKDMDKLDNLKPTHTKKWFRKQFGIRKNKGQLEDEGRPHAFDVPAFRKDRRRSSSLPDLSAMLDAANLKRFGSFTSISPGPARMAGKETIANLKEKNQEKVKNGQKGNGTTERDNEVEQKKAPGEEHEGRATLMTINELVPKCRCPSRSVPGLSGNLDDESQKKHEISSPETAKITRKQAILSEEDAPWA